MRATRFVYPFVLALGLLGGLLAAAFIAPGLARPTAAAAAPPAGSVAAGDDARSLSAANGGGVSAGVSNNPPVITNGATINLTAMRGNTINFWPAATDAETPTGQLRWTSTTPSSGFFRATNETGVGDQAGRYSYSSSRTDVSSVSFTVTVTDAQGASDSVTINVTIVAQPTLNAGGTPSSPSLAATSSAGAPYDLVAAVRQVEAAVVNPGSYPVRLVCTANGTFVFPTAGFVAPVGTTTFRCELQADLVFWQSPGTPGVLEIPLTPGTVTWTVTVAQADTVPPVFGGVAEESFLRDATSAAGRSFFVNPRSATDDSGVAPTVDCRLPGNVLVPPGVTEFIIPIGRTTMTCTATDGAGNVSQGNRIYIVQPTFASAAPFTVAEDAVAAPITLSPIVATGSTPPMRSSSSPRPASSPGPGRHLPTPPSRMPPGRSPSR